MKHQSIVLDEIPSKLNALVEEELAKEPYGEHLIQTRVELANLNNSALNVLIGAMFTGKADSEHRVIRKKLIKIGVEACNRFGWQIALPQLKIHRSDSFGAAKIDLENLE